MVPHRREECCITRLKSYLSLFIRSTMYCTLPSDGNHISKKKRYEKFYGFHNHIRMLYSKILYVLILTSNWISGSSLSSLLPSFLPPFVPASPFLLSFFSSFTHSPTQPHTQPVTRLIVCLLARSPTHLLTFFLV